MQNSAHSRNIARISANYSTLDNLSEADAVALLRAEGITTLEHLVSHILTKRKEGRPYPAAIIGADAIEEGLPIKHVVPHIPVLIDGTEYEPRDVVRFDGTPLHFIYSQSTDGGTLFQATTDRSQMNTLCLIWSLISKRGWTGGPDGSLTYDQSPGSNPPPPHAPKPPPYNGTSIQMFSDANYEGDWFWLNQGYQWPKLSKVNRNTVLFFSGDWNDQISSLAGTGGFVTYFEHANYQGSSFTPLMSAPIPDLSLTGWNDRISSVRYPVPQY